MNQDIIQGKWEQVKGHIQKEWSELTDKDIEKIKGKKDELLGLLQERYGYTVDVAETKMKDFIEKMKNEYQADSHKIVEMCAQCRQNLEGKMKNNVFQTALVAFGIGFLSEKILRSFMTSSK